jgi:hypothetical protein
MYFGRALACLGWVILTLVKIIALILIYSGWSATYRGPKSASVFLVWHLILTAKMRWYPRMAKSGSPILLLIHVLPLRVYRWQRVTQR